MEIRFDRQEVFLTGASRGIGKKIKELLEQNGAIVTAPGRAELDLADRSSIDAYVSEHGELCPDIFIHCAGVNKLAGIEELTPDVLEEVFQVNYYAPVHLLSKLVPVMKQKRTGRIVFISSLYAMVSRERRIAYSSSKNALTGLMKSLALELAPYDIMVNCVAPGYVMTDMTKKNLSDSEQKEIVSKIPTGRFQTEEEIASLVMFLCSVWNTSVTGQLIAADGGFTCR